MLKERKQERTSDAAPPLSPHLSGGSNSLPPLSGGSTSLSPSLMRLHLSLPVSQVAPPLPPPLSGGSTSLSLPQVAPPLSFLLTFSESVNFF